jgi:energy-coupling factor transport system substrate-specific component
MTNSSVNYRISISEMVFIAVLSVAFGVAWWGYTFIYDLLSPFLRGVGAEGILTGFWYMGGVFFAYIIRKPGSALLGEVIASLVEGIISHWGIGGTLLYGITQGLAVELVFLILCYKRWNAGYLALAGALSGGLAALLSVYVYQYYKLGFGYCVVQIAATAISGLFLAGLFSKFLADKLAKTGVLNQFNIARNEQ